jgi:hypothetical protein
MRKLALAAGSALTYLLVTAATAFADSGIPPGSEPPVHGDIVTPPDGTAFTGANIAIWLVAIAALVVVGATLLVVSRRRAASAG